ncbi:MAG: M48 family metallopeptidase [Clostridia bacterium]|nr:M48 family metallopeptidase [Clostridia bacterium]
MSEIEYTLVRSDRKTTAIRVLTDGSVEVRAPRRLPVQEIERFLSEKKDWIEKHRRIMRERYPLDLEPRKILYKGKWKTILPLGENKILFDGEFFYAPEHWSDAELKKAVEEILKKLARSELIPLTRQIALHVGAEPQRITVTGAKTKWGSCSDGKNINLSWRLLAAPVDAIEYVIIHELCHMREMNHSERFWALVEQHVPDWRKKREKLSQVQVWLDAYFK